MGSNPIRSILNVEWYMRVWTLIAGVVLTAGLFPSSSSAQTTDDSVRVMLEAARVLERDGRSDLARELLEYVQRRWPGRAVADTALMRLRTGALESTAFSRGAFIGYHTFYGAFLGVAIPAAFGAEDPEPYGAGLLLGAPLGFFAARGYSRGNALTPGQAGIIEFGSFWGTWTGIAVQLLFDIGERTTCDFDVCFTETPASATWTAAVIGGVLGLGTGVTLARRPVASGTSSLVFHSSLWGTWYGFATGVLLGAEGENERLAATVIGGNAAVLLAIPLASRWRPTSTRVRIASAGGLAGGLAGLGTVLLFDIEGEKGIVATTTAGATLGLVLGSILSSERDATSSAAAPGFSPALLSGDGRLTLGIPLPTPHTVLLPGDATARVWRIGLLDARF